MNVHDLITEADIEDAPEAADDAFVFLVAAAERRLDERISNLADDNDSWRDINAMRYSFMNVVNALAKSYKIDAFSDYILPSRTQYSGDGFDEFKAELDHYLTQQLVNATIRARRDSIVAYPVIRETIRTHLHHIKVHIDKADIPESRKAALHAKLAEFEKALERSRINIVAVTRVVIEAISLSANVMTVSDSGTLHKLLTGIMVDVGIEKAQQAQSRLLTSDTPPQIEVTPTKMKVEKPQSHGYGYGRGAKQSFPADLDDEIPF